ncbi:MAG: ABC transporter ATP-binding protein [Deltaproteobacteria bacterium]|nr:MAG: ABC transporter ATP-binding protein [Deltaproteobacteria bacterium]
MSVSESEGSTFLNEKGNLVDGKDSIILEGKSLCKGFPGVWEHLILDHIDIDVKAGEIHTLLGENGAGKTVIANCLSGFYILSEGQIYVKGKPVTLKSPRDGIRHGIGMVHQELALVKPFTVAQNIALGIPSSDLAFPLPEVEERVRKLSEKYGLYIDPRARIEDLSAGEQQRAEIIKVLYHDPEILILDEPTSLISTDAEHLFGVLNSMAEMGYGILFITHKIEEALEVGDRVTVLRLGKTMGTRETARTDKTELVKLMFGEHTPVHLERQPVKSERLALEVKNLEALSANKEPALQGVSFTIREGEILGFAGVSGNGQSELAQVITGLRRATKGQVIIQGEDHTNHKPGQIIKAGVAHIPEKRREMGVVEPMTVAENVFLKDIRLPPFSKGSFLNVSQITAHAQEIVSRFGALVSDLWKSQTRILSGGNIQRLILGRETWRTPKCVVAVYPTHGLDAKAIDRTLELFMRLREAGSAILLISEDLDEIMALSDRIAVMSQGKIVGMFDGSAAKREEIGLMIATGAPET